MRILLTGGAGFIGRHVLAELLGRGHQVRVLDSLRPDVHRGERAVRCRSSWSWPTSATRTPSTRRCAASRRSATWRRRSGWGWTCRTCPTTPRPTTSAPRCCWPAWPGPASAGWCWPARWWSTARAWAAAPRTAQVRPGPRTEVELAAGQFEPPCPVCGLALAPGPGGRGRPARPAQRLRRQQVARRSSWPRPGPGSTGGQVAAMRYHNVYGPGMPRDTPYAGVAAIFLSALRSGRLAQVYEDGGQRRDFVHVRDVAAATVAALRRPGGRRHAAGLQRRLGHPAHGRRAGRRAQPGRRRAGPADHRRLPAGRRPAHHRRLGPAARRTALAARRWTSPTGSPNSPGCSEPPLAA